MVPEAFAVAVRNVADHSFHDVHLRAIVFSAVQKFLLEQDQRQELDCPSCFEELVCLFCSTSCQFMLF